jgi:hypothetical protein
MNYTFQSQNGNGNDDDGDSNSYYTSKYGTAKIPSQHLSRLHLFKGDGNRIFHIVPMR